MKTVVTILMVWLAGITMAQEAGVFYLYVRADETLIEEHKVETTSDRPVLTGYSVGISIPDELLETVKQVTAELVSEKLGVQSGMLYVSNKKGKEKVTAGTELFPGMPFVNKGTAIKTEEKKYYVHIYADIRAQGSVSTNLSKTKKRKPMIELRLTVYDASGETYFKNKAVLRDFGVLQSSSRIKGKVKVINAEVLTPESIVGMYIAALEASLFNE